MILDSSVSTELLFIISQLPISLKNKIPKEIQEELQNTINHTRYDSFIPDKPYFKQNISEEALSAFKNLIDQYLL